MDLATGCMQGTLQSNSAFGVNFCMPRAPLAQAQGISPPLASATKETLSDGLQQPDRRDSGAPNGDSSKPKRRKRARSNEEVKRACHECQQRKSKCSGSRPMCQFCSERNLTCTYDGAPGQKAMLQVKSACLRCHKRKAKCSGERPACQFCREPNLECKWDVADGATR